MKERFQSPELPPGYDTDLRYLLMTGSNLAFEAFDGKTWIDRYRVTNDSGRLDIANTALTVGIPTSIVFKGDPRLPANTGSTRGIIRQERVKGESLEILLREDADSLPKVFGHELGHIFLEQLEDGFHDKRNKGEEHWDIERFCDYFGLQMALPLSELGNVTNVSKQTILDIATQYDVMPSDATLQLMLANKLPSKIYADIPMYSNPAKIDRTVVCKQCELGHNHDNTDQDSNAIPVFDFTDGSWKGIGGLDACRGEIYWSATSPLHKELNQQYGRWSTEDDIAKQALIAQKTEKEHRVKSPLEEFDMLQEFSRLIHRRDIENNK